MVVFTAGLLMILMGMVAKFGAFVAGIPPPVYGGLFLVMFGT